MSPSECDGHGVTAAEISSVLGSGVEALERGPFFQAGLVWSEGSGRGSEREREKERKRGGERQSEKRT